MSTERTLTSAEHISDKHLVDSLYEFIANEKKQLRCPEDGPDEQRYIIYSAAFDKVIEHAGAYKTVLSVIKREYDELITSAKKRNREVRLAHGRLKGKVAEQSPLTCYQRRSAQLRDRIEIVQRDTAELQNECTVLRSLQTEEKPLTNQAIFNSKGAESILQIPGLTLEDSMNPTTLAKHLEHLSQKRAELLTERMSQNVPAQVMEHLGSKMKVLLDQRNQLLLENERLHLWNKKLKFISDTLCYWEKSGRDPPLTDFLASVLQQITEHKAFDCDSHSTTSESSEEDEATTGDRSDPLVEYLQRFTDLFECGEFEAAAFHATECHQGLLRDMGTLDKFQSVSVSSGTLPPVLLFLQASMALVHCGKRLPSEGLSVEAVKCALQHGRMELVTHWVTQNRLTFCEALGDAIRTYQPTGAREADICLALAQSVYRACGAQVKAAACLCDRGMRHAAMELIHLDRAFTVDDCVCLLKSCPSLELVKGLTWAHWGQPALLSVGFATYTLLNTESEELAFQLLESIQNRGPGVLDETILRDSSCTAEGWGTIAEHCMRRGQRRLARDILSVLTAQPGTVLLCPDAEGVELMEHVFM